MAIVSISNPHTFCPQLPLPEMPFSLLFGGVHLLFFKDSAQGHKLCDNFPNPFFHPQQ